MPRRCELKECKKCGYHDTYYGDLCKLCDVELNGHMNEDYDG
jgi:Zn ribbon nucleic-acid-binding protein